MDVPINQLESILGPPRPYVFEVKEEVAKRRSAARQFAVPLPCSPEPKQLVEGVLIDTYGVKARGHQWTAGAFGRKHELIVRIDPGLGFAEDFDAEAVGDRG